MAFPPMPPTTTQPAMPLRIPSPPHNASVRHPVFFTERLRRPVVGTGTVAANYPGNPVAQGYIYRDGQRQLDGTGAAPKL